MSSDRPLPPSITPERAPARDATPKSTAPVRKSAAAPTTATQAVPVGRLGAFGRVERVSELAAEEAEQVNGTEATGTEHLSGRTTTMPPPADLDGAGPDVAEDDAPEAEEVRPAGPRRVRLAISRVDPWSVMKLSFLLSVAIGIMIVVAVAVVWMTLDGLGVFTSINDTITEIVGDESFINVLEYVEFSRVMSLATFIAVVDVVLLTALGTIGAFLYNITAALVGGIHLTLTDE